jgi:ABC-type branched-subunit amino acid transport system permease subunit
MLLAQIVLNGILLGGLYACMAISFSLIWGVMNIINLAHGSMMLVGAYVTYALHSRFGIDPILTIPFSAAALFILGYALQRLVFNRVVMTSIFLTLILTFGLDMILINFNIALFTADVRSITTWYSSMALEIGGVRLAYTRIAVFVLALLITLALHQFLTWSRTGHAIRATAQDPKAARVMGINTLRIYAITFGLGAAMAGAAGSLITVVYAFSPIIGDPFTLKSFVVVILGGLGNIFGTILAGILLGVAENLVSGFVHPGYRDAISFGLLLAVLVLRPTGFLGKMPSAAPRPGTGTAPPDTPRSRIDWRNFGVLLTLGGALLLLLLAPLYVSLYWQRILSTAFMFATLAQAINLIAGFTGYPAFGNVVFFGLGSYSAAIVMVKAGESFVLGLLAAVLISLATVLLVGPPLLRLRGHYFAIATVGLNEMIKALASNLTPLTGGGMGLSVPLPPWGPARAAQVFYYLLLGTMIASILIGVWFKVSRLGHACRAIRDDEVKAEAMGLRTTTIKTAAWAVSAMLTGLVGGIYAYWFSYVEPPAVFDLQIAIKCFVMFLLGGTATILGPIVAAFFVEFISTVLWSHLLNYHLGALGLGIVLIVLYMPNGFINFMRDRSRIVAALLRA